MGALAASEGSRGQSGSVFVSAGADPWVGRAGVAPWVGNGAGGEGRFSCPALRLAAWPIPGQA